MHRISNEKGLTLLELLVVLAVIGIVATFTIPNISKFATGRTAEKDLATIRSLIDYAKTASYSKGKTMVLLQTNQSTMQVFELSSNDPTKCLGNVNVDNEYSKAISLMPHFLAKFIVSSISFRFDKPVEIIKGFLVLLTSLINEKSVISNEAIL